MQYSVYIKREGHWFMIGGARTFDGAGNIIDVYLESVPNAEFKIIDNEKDAQ